MLSYGDILNEAADGPLNYDIKSRFNEFNRRFFNNELPQCPLSMGVMKGMSGHCRCKLKPPAERLSPRALRIRGLHRYHGYTLVPGSISIKLSTTYERTHEQLDGILLHEMIHAWFYMKERFDVNHDTPFLIMRKELQEKSGIPIPLTEKVSDLELTSDVKTKTVLVLVYSRGDTKSFALLNTNVLGTDNIEAERASWERQVARNPGSSVEMRKVSGPEWTKLAAAIPISRGRIKSTWKIKAEWSAAMEEFSKAELIFAY